MNPKCACCDADAIGECAICGRTGCSDHLEEWGGAVLCQGCLQMKTQEAKGRGGDKAIPGDPAYDMDAGAVKYDADKPACGLFPPHAMLALGALFARGAKKYTDRNWEKGFAYTRPLGAALRHVFKFMAGEDYDRTDGQHHLISAAWCALILYETIVAGRGTDDRSTMRLTDDYKAHAEVDFFA